ncbi:hypothetical protein CB1_000909002 [Camelus ferus]|nr:hypothetical protein CB1_000909002 [Camelus ferus]
MRALLSLTLPMEPGKLVPSCRDFTLCNPHGTWNTHSMPDYCPLKRATVSGRAIVQTEEGRTGEAGGERNGGKVGGSKKLQEDTKATEDRGSVSISGKNNTIINNNTLA